MNFTERIAERSKGHQTVGSGHPAPITGRLLSKFLNSFFHLSPGLGSVGLMVPMASPGVPPHGKNQKQAEPSPAHPHFSKNLNLDKTLLIFFGLWQDRVVTDNKK
jgi:hypothetical protein